MWTRSRKENANMEETDSAKGAMPEKGVDGGEQDSVILAELRKLRQEHTEAANENRKALVRLETNVGELVERTASLERRTVEVEDRLGETEDRAARLERSVAFLLHQEAMLTAKCDDLESRSRRNNIRIHGIPEGAERDDTISFVTDFIRSTLKIPVAVDIRIERAHRSLVTRPTGSMAPPRAIIARFIDHQVKDRIIQQAWKQKITYEGRTIYFNQDYTNDVQKKRKQVRDVIKKLKEKNIKAQSPYPAKLKVFLEGGTKTYATLMEAAPMLKDMGIHVDEDEWEKLQRVRMQSSWTAAAGPKGRRRKPRITEADLQALML